MVLFARHVLRSRGGVAVAGRKIDKPPIDYDLISGDRCYYHQEPRSSGGQEKRYGLSTAFGRPRARRSTHNGVAACALALAGL
ncbi:hypothetical protein MRX96_030662 [Rhipicephalus microplus]